MQFMDLLLHLERTKQYRNLKIYLAGRFGCACSMRRSNHTHKDEEVKDGKETRIQNENTNNAKTYMKNKIYLINVNECNKFELV